MTWRDWVGHGMEAQFNPRVAVGPETENWLNSWARKSGSLQSKFGGVFNIAYGKHKLMQFDYLLGKPDLPVIVNIHGGFWRALDKSDMSYHMAKLASSGFGIVNLNYPLCPEFTLTDIMGHLESSIDAIVSYCDNQVQGGTLVDFVLMGHSVGAHMALHISHHAAFRERLIGVIAISGIYETGLVRHLAVNKDVQMSQNEALRWDCLKNMPQIGLRYYIAAGGAEPSGWIDQSWMMAQAISMRNDKVHFRVCSRANHFSIVDLLCDSQNPDGAHLHSWIRGLQIGYLSKA